MPPCICTASAATLVKASLAATRASAADVADGSAMARFDHRPRRLHRDVQVGHPVLERLEAADRAAELNPVLGVFDGQVETLRRGADLLGGHQDRRGVGQAGIGADVRGVLRLDPRQRAGQVHGVDGLRREGGPPGERLAVGGDDDVGDGAVDHIVGIEDHRADRGTFGQLLDRIGIGFVGGEQRELGQRRAQQRRRHQRLAQLLEDDGGVGELAPGTAQLLGHHQCGRTDLLAQQLPQRLVVAVLRLDRLAHRGR